ncbi:biotin transporter BioY [Pelagovum pacificum]|uniref:Biotin transporter n=2 Tax=Pelagovum pacificum TaxID=2588711 RepID=A0A5C5GII2_9RHOB|nr:biotin transporter BioY [Pelagovum pacificum]TNY34320.1 biotin transporter BioY [Pelagovum pacificum]
MTDKVLADAVWPSEAEGRSKLLRQAALVAGGILFMILASKIRVPMWPVPVTMQTFGALTVGAVLGARLGLVSMFGYLALGALGMQVFTGETAGLGYMVGPTGGYLVGFAFAAWAMGALSRRGWDRSVGGMVGALLIGNAIIYAVGVPWMAYLFAAERGMGWVIEWGFTKFLIGDALKLALAAMILPAAWRFAARR